MGLMFRVLRAWWVFRVRRVGCSVFGGLGVRVLLFKVDGFIDGYCLVYLGF